MIAAAFIASTGSTSNSNDAGYWVQGAQNWPLPRNVPDIKAGNSVFTDRASLDPIVKAILVQRCRFDLLIEPSITL
jgi:hypothetical protein